MRRPPPAPTRRWWWPLALRCPWCGSRGITERFGLVERCPVCGLRTDRSPGHWIGAIGLNTIVSFTVLFVVLATAVAVSWPDAPGPWWLVGALATAAGLPLVLLPWARVGWLAIDVRMSPPGQPDDDGSDGDDLLPTDDHRR